MAGRPGSGARATLQVLADPLSRELLTVLSAARAPRSTPQIVRTDLAGGPPIRTVRTRLCTLAAAGLLCRVPQRRSTDSGRAHVWSVTRAGLALVRIGEVMALAAVRADRKAPPPGSPRERMQRLGKVLELLADDVTQEVLRALTGRPLDTTAIVAACDRRRGASETVVSRRLRRLAQSGVVVQRRTHEIPSRVEHRIAPHWYPLATILLLVAYWELRHDPTALDGRSWTADLRALLTAVAPAARMPTRFNGKTMRWSVVDAPLGRTDTILRVEDGSLCVLEPSSPGPAAIDAGLSGPSATWIPALVRQELGDLEAQGDPRLTAATIRALDDVLIGREGRGKLTRLFRASAAPPARPARGTDA